MRKANERTNWLLEFSFWGALILLLAFLSGCSTFCEIVPSLCSTGRSDVEVVKE
jgi:hypothetical protein